VQGLLPSLPFLALDDLSAPATDRFAIAISRWWINNVSTFLWIFQSPQWADNLGLSRPSHTPHMIIRGYDNIPWITDALSTRDKKRSVFRTLAQLRIM